MKTTLMATVAAVALIASAGLASAQRQEAPASSTQAPNPAPSAQQQAPAEKTAPNGAVTPDKKTQMKPSRSDTTGQATPSGQQPKMGEDQPKGSPHAQPKMGQDQPKASPNGQPKMGQDQPKASPNGQPKNSTAQQPNSKQSPTTGQATRPAGDSVTLNAEQKTKLRTTVVAKAPKVTNINFSVSVGTVVPHTVHVVAVPSTLIEIHPAWRGYMYFVANDQIIVVEPRTLKIVAVLDV